MVRGTTPTFILTLPDTVDMTIIRNLYFSLAQGDLNMVKKGDDLSIDGQVISVYLTQDETLKFKPGTALLQLNWTYDNGSRACSNIVNVTIGRNLLGEVVL